MSAHDEMAAARARIVAVIEALEGELRTEQVRAVSAVRQGVHERLDGALAALAAFDNCKSGGAS